MTVDCFNKNLWTDRETTHSWCQVIRIIIIVIWITIVRDYLINTPTKLYKQAADEKLQRTSMWTINISLCCSCIQTRRLSRPQEGSQYNSGVRCHPEFYRYICTQTHISWEKTFDAFWKLTSISACFVTFQQDIKMPPRSLELGASEVKGSSQSLIYYL